LRGRHGPRRAAPGHPRALARGARITCTFEQMGPDGEALGRGGGRIVAVPYAAPGDQATVEITEPDRKPARGRLVALREPAAGAGEPLCPHFGDCGGCQWQHLDYAVQLEQKTRLVREALGPGLPDLPVEPAVGWGPPWGYRSLLEAAAAAPSQSPALGFYAWGSDRVIDIQTCPVQHPANVVLLEAVRARWPRLPDGPRLRGVLGRVGSATGEVLLGLAVGGRLDAGARTAVVRALLDRIPGLVGIVEIAAPPAGHLLRSRRSSLLWGRAWVREEVAGVRYRVPLLAEFPANPRAFAGAVELVLGALDASRDDTVVEIGAGIGAYTLQLALATGRAVGVTTGALLAAARANARHNGLENCTFYARDVVRAVEKAARVRGVGCALIRPQGGALAPAVVRALRRAGVRRLAYLGRSLRGLDRDAAALRAGGYLLRWARPLDMSPHTSRTSVLMLAEAR